MRFTLAAVFAGVAAVANAHFQLAYPPPRGVFDEENEVNFCGTYPFRFVYLRRRFTYSSFVH